MRVLGLASRIRPGLAAVGASAILCLAVAGCAAPPPPATGTADPTTTPTAAPTPTAVPTPGAAPSRSPTSAATPGPAPPTTAALPEWDLHDAYAEGSTAVVVLRVPAGVDVRVTLDGRQPDEISRRDGMLRHVFRDVGPGKHSVLARDVTGRSASREIEVAVPSPTTTATAQQPPPDPSTPTPVPTPSRAERIEAALSENIPWYGDPPYPLAVVPIREVWHQYPELGREVAQSPWIADGLSAWEDDAVYGLAQLAGYDLALARQVLAYTMEEPVQSRNTLLLSTLGRMISQHRETFELLVGQPWFADGLDAGERAFITAVSHITGVEELYRRLLAERFSRSTVISLPLAGKVNVWVFSNDDAPALNDHVLAAVERGARGAERLMGAPFPLTDLIVLSVDADAYGIGYGGVNWGDSLVFLRGERLDPPNYDLTLYHEIAHFWLHGDLGPFWLVEGGANMVAAYVRADGQPLAVGADISYCQERAVPNIWTISEPDHPDPTAQSTCGYLLGHHFLATLFNTIGEASFSSAMRELYGLSLDYQPPATDEQVYRIFLKHTPPGREASFRDVFERLHGGPFLNRE